MPELSRFYGIVIKMFFGDHAPPHFHAEFGDHEALINIRTFGVIQGQLPPRIIGMVVEWTAIHQTELLADWELARNLEPLEPIDPLP